MRSLHPAAGPGIGTGRVVYFLWGHGGDPKAEAGAKGPNVETLTKQGYTVVVDTAPGQRALK